MSRQLKNRQSVTVDQIQALDRRAIDKLGVPSVVLMENAGRAVADEVQRRLKGKRKAVVTVVCGAGNNGGDGFVAARHLINRGVVVRIFLAGPPRNLKMDAAVNYWILKKSGCKIRSIRTADKKFRTALENSAVIVDAVFGVGLNRPLEGMFRDVIEAINASRAKVIAADIPSGLDGDTGKIWGTCVRAAATVTFSFAKNGMYRAQGPKHTGKLIVADIGIPRCR